MTQTNLRTPAQMQSTKEKHVDLLVIGGGSAGIGAARYGARRHKKVLLIEKDKIGGDCTFFGCVPSKALIEAANRGYDFVKAQNLLRNSIKTISEEENFETLSKEKIECIQGSASFLSPSTIEVEGCIIKAKKIIIATGASPIIPPIPGLDSVNYLTHKNIFDIPKLPKSLGIIGAGAIGAELASAFSKFGSKVTVVDALDRVLTKEDPEASDIVFRSLKANGVNFHLNAQISEISKLNGYIEIKLSNSESVEVEELLVATGRKPNSATLKLERAGVKTERNGRIISNKFLRTNIRSIYAAGDVTSEAQFTHAAYRTGFVAAINALSPIPIIKYEPNLIPRVTFTTPEVASIGLTGESSNFFKVVQLQMSSVDRAIVSDSREGYIKLVSKKRPLVGYLGGGKIVGATIVCERAGELINEVALAISKNLTAFKLATTTHAYPTWSMAIQQAASKLLDY